jgi:hypothetical protein
VKLASNRNIIIKFQNQQEIRQRWQEKISSLFFLPNTKKETTTVEIKSNTRSFETSKTSREKENK